jgi:hypothetical protein
MTANSIAMDIDLFALRVALAETGAAITELKLLLRRTWTRPMAAEQRMLSALKEKATLLYILRAYLRGRHHLQRPMRRGSWPGMTWDPDAFHRQAAERAVARFDLARPATSEVAP